MAVQSLASYRWPASSAGTPELSTSSSHSSIASLASIEPQHPAALPIDGARRSSALTVETKAAIPTVARRDTVSWWLGTHAGSD